MSKENRCQVDEVYVFGFVPSYLLPKRHPACLDPFMEPFIRDIEEGFINGKYYLASKSSWELAESWFSHVHFTIQYNNNICPHSYWLWILIWNESDLNPWNCCIGLIGIQVNYVVPVCVLCCSGDHMGLCELGKFVKCGKKGCRRCETTSMFPLFEFLGRVQRGN